MNDDPNERSLAFALREGDAEDVEESSLGSEEKCGKLRPNVEATVCKAGQKFTRDELI